VFQSIDHHWSTNVFATCGQQVDVWDEERAEPVRSFTWGVDSINCVKFNPIEVCIMLHIVQCLSVSFLFITMSHRDMYKHGDSVIPPVIWFK